MDIIIPVPHKHCHILTASEFQLMTKKSLAVRTQNNAYDYDHDHDLHSLTAIQRPHPKLFPRLGHGIQWGKTRPSGQRVRVH
jgi:hypothetical protein